MRKSKRKCEGCWGTFPVEEILYAPLAMLHDLGTQYLYMCPECRAKEEAEIAEREAE